MNDALVAVGIGLQRDCRAMGISLIVAEAVQLRRGCPLRNEQGRHGQRGLRRRGQPACVLGGQRDVVDAGREARQKHLVPVDGGLAGHVPGQGSGAHAAVLGVVGAAAQEHGVTGLEQLISQRRDEVGARRLVRHHKGVRGRQGGIVAVTGGHAHQATRATAGDAEQAVEGQREGIGIGQARPVVYDGEPGLPQVGAVLDGEEQAVVHVGVGGLPHNRHRIVEGFAAGRLENVDVGDVAARLQAIDDDAGDQQLDLRHRDGGGGEGQHEAGLFDRGRIIGDDLRCEDVIGDHHSVGIPQTHEIWRGGRGGGSGRDGHSQRL